VNGCSAGVHLDTRRQYPCLLVRAKSVVRFWGRDISSPCSPLLAKCCQVRPKNRELLLPPTAHRNLDAPPFCWFFKGRDDGPHALPRSAGAAPLRIDHKGQEDATLLWLPNGLQLPNLVCPPVQWMIWWLDPPPAKLWQSALDLSFLCDHRPCIFVACTVAEFQRCDGLLFCILLMGVCCKCGCR
jgi:hypothetical protein